MPNTHQPTLRDIGDLYHGKLGTNALLLILYHSVLSEPCYQLNVTIVK